MSNYLKVRGVTCIFNEPIVYVIACKLNRGIAGANAMF